ncbi:MAG: hypothetical protein E7616_09665 [Ruminococcaceae bacterium]|nr:hypothetical protein [Oscillospiraceae bacterium]
MGSYKITKKYRDGSCLIEHRDATGFLLAKYIGWYSERTRAYTLYPARGERHYQCHKHQVAERLVKA